ncbi:flagellar filament capping protein FliD [Rhodoferax sp. GW822-FHT02A01]|uniref:flagellar filament capping protein FliD n=1 Tax=Rhodoferax sp. GW822-FHT02A01 TaxID=3141537 RepID=UPI00315CB2A4
MAISSTGIGSGLDINSIVSQLVAVEQQPIKLLQAKVSTLQTKMSAFGQVKSELSALQDAASALMSSATWNGMSFSSGNASALTGTATSTAVPGSHSVTVNNLVTAQTLKSAAITSGSAMGASGTLTFYTGYYNTDSPSKFVSSGASDTVSVSATDTLADVVTNINAKSSTLGVTASIVTTSGKQQLVIRGNSTGANAAFQVDASSGLEQLRYMPSNIVDSSGTAIASSATSAQDMTYGQLAADASVTIDGITVTSSTNTVSDALSGVTLNLLTPTTTPTQITIATDKATMKAKIQAFQDAYNTLYADLKTQTAYDSTTKTGGPLLGDNTANSVQNMLRTLVGAAGPSSSTLGRLSDLGLEIQKDGSLKTNASKLDAALQNPTNVKNFFSTITGTANGNGIAKRVYDFAFGALGVGGSVSGHSTAFQKSIDQNNATIDKFNDHITAYRKQLLAQYTALDTNMAKLNSLSTYVSQQVTTWNKSG